MTDVGWPDAVVSIVLGLGAFMGFRRGLIGELMGTLALAAGVVAAICYSGGLDGAVEGITHLKAGSAHIVGMFAFALVAYLLVMALGLVLSNVAKLPLINLVNGIGGACVGLLKALLFVWVALYVALFFPLPNDLHDDLHRSYLVSLIVAPNGRLDDGMRDRLPDYVRPFADALFDRHHV